MRASHPVGLWIDANALAPFSLTPKAAARSLDFDNCHVCYTTEALTQWGSL